MDSEGVEGTFECIDKNEQQRAGGSCEQSETTSETRLES